MTWRNEKAYWLTGLLLTTSAFAMSCNDDAAADAEGEALARRTGATCSSDSMVTYEGFAQAFVSTYCLRCHSASIAGAARKGAPADHNFDKLADIALFADHIDQMAGSGPTATNVTMPPDDPKPSIGDRAKLSQWIACRTP